MEIFKGLSGVRLSMEELVELFQRDMVDDLIKLISTLDALEIDIEELLSYMDGEEAESLSNELRIDQILKTLYPDHDGDR